MHVNFISSKDTGETRTIYVWNDNVKIMWGSDTDDIIRWLLHKAATINPKNEDN